MSNQDHDPTENARRELQPQVNSLSDEAIESTGPTWDTEALQRAFEVLGFAAPFIVVRRKSDGKKGTMLFRHHPRVYFAFKADGE